MRIDHDDPVQQIIDREESLDHARATARGLRVLDITNIVAAALDGHGLLRNQRDARRIIWAALAESLYGYDTAIDIPKING